MKVHEYQAKSIFASYGLPVDRNIVCRTPDEAVAAYKHLGLAKAVVKAQVHPGGDSPTCRSNLRHGHQRVHC